MDAADVSDEAMLSAEEDPREDEEEEECRICRLPAEPARPLRHPCACRGSIRFVHDDCQLQWIAARQKRRCEVSLIVSRRICRLGILMSTVSVNNEIPFIFVHYVPISVPFTS
jgi:E3 ubiquitin-protein ligase DOA10